LLAAALRFLSGWFVASFAFWTTRIHGILHLYDRLAFVLAGQIAPLALLPSWLAGLGYALPFAYMLWAPAEILRGGLSLEQALLVTLVQVVWLAVSWFAFVLLWRLGLRQFSAVGA
jgi:ABC-2 type transport system permease protein